MRYLYSLFLVVIVCITCQSESDYQRLVRKELAKGIRVDEVYLDIYLGMPQQEFYDYCWEMNRENKMQQGPSNMTVQVDMSDTLRHPSKMFFYPTFVDGKIASVPMSFSYDAWAPWNKQLATDSLLVDVVDALGRWYGELERMGDSERGYVYVRVDGNRQVKVFKQALKNQVKVVISDLTVDKAKREAAG